MEFIHDDFLLHSEMARRLYHDYAAAEPILDYHSHLPPSDIAADHRFRNLFGLLTVRRGPLPDRGLCGNRFGRGATAFVVAGQPPLGLASRPSATERVEGSG